jgi:CRP/FNR family cyclic AMP-dependent transcriptional regulator
MTVAQMTFAKRTRKQSASETLRPAVEILEFLSGKLPKSSRRKIAMGKHLYSQGEEANELFVVVSGRVAISMVRPDGKEFLIDIVGPGALCGEGAAFDKLMRISGALAIEDCEVVVLTSKRLCELLASHPEATQVILHAMAQKQRMLISRLLQVTQMSPQDRIADLLKQMAIPERKIIALTHQQSASLIGASRVTVTRAMRRMQRGGIVKCSRGRYELMASPASALRN